MPGGQRAAVGNQVRIIAAVSSVGKVVAKEKNFIAAEEVGEADAGYANGGAS